MTHSHTSGLSGEKGNPAIPSVERAVLGKRSWDFGGIEQEPHHQRGGWLSEGFLKAYKLIKEELHISQRSAVGGWLHSTMGSMVLQI